MALQSCCSTDAMRAALASAGASANLEPSLREHCFPLYGIADVPADVRHGINELIQWID